MSNQTTTPKLTITAFKDGNIIREYAAPSSKAIKKAEKDGKPAPVQYASIRLVKETVSMGSNGFMHRSKRNAFAKAPLAWFEEQNLKAGMCWNDILALNGATGHADIYRKESLEPFYTDQEPKMNPDTNENITDADGNDIYFQDVVESANGTNCDVLILTAAQAAVLETSEEFVEEEA